MAAIQEISGRIGRTTGRGIAANMRKHYPNWILQGIVALLLVANTINIGADLGAMGDAVSLMIGGPRIAYVIAFGVLCAALQVLMKYTRYVSVLKWLTLALFAYFGTVMVVNVPWGEAARGFFIPTFTTRFELLDDCRGDPRHHHQPLSLLLAGFAGSRGHRRSAGAQAAGRRTAPRPRRERAHRHRHLCRHGIFQSCRARHHGDNAATLHATGNTDIQTSSQAAEALKPVAGDFAFAIFALGIIGTGLLAVPVLAGSAAYALGEARRWPVGLAREPMRGQGVLCDDRVRDARRRRYELHRRSIRSRRCSGAP